MTRAIPDLFLERQPVHVVEHGDRATRLGVTSKQPREKQPRLARSAGFLGPGNLGEQRLVPRQRLAPAVAQPVQAHVGRDAVQEARGKADVEPRAVLHHADEDVLACVESFVLVAQQPSAPAEHHRPVPARQGLDVHVPHVTDLNTEEE